MQKKTPILLSKGGLLIKIILVNEQIKIEGKDFSGWLDFFNLDNAFREMSAKENTIFEK